MNICKGIWSYAIDPRLLPEKRAAGDYTGSVAIINACRPFHWRKDFPPTTKMSEETLQRYRAKWGKILMS